MRPFIRGFTHELLKLAAFPQQAGNQQPYEAATARVMDQTQGSGIRIGLKTGQPLQPAPAARRASPTPLTTPNSMVGGG